jgi:putative endonuclease
MQSYFVYVIRSLSKPNSFYIGFSSNPIRRLESHNHPKNSGFTKKAKPWVLVYVEVFPTKQDALIRERQLKTSRGRAWVKETFYIRD